jgi:hypothetical protein
MGLDGGTFATRADIMRRSSWRLACADASWSTRGGALDRGTLVASERVDPAQLGRIKWSTCALSGEALREPVVACELGSLYNRESVLEFLLGSLQFPYNNQHAVKRAFGHLRSMKCVFQLQLHWQPAAAGVATAGTTAAATTTIVCPIVQVPADGRQPFVALRPCGHVLSARALRSLHAER